MSLATLLTSFSTARMVVIGDNIADVYHFGRTDRLSPEAPVPVFVENDRDNRSGRRRGGADNVAHQLEKLRVSVKTHLPPVVSEKHRYMVGHHQLFRIDADQYAPIDWIKPYWISDARRDCDAVILSDYGKGALTYNNCAEIIRSFVQVGIPVIVDPKGSDFGKYRGATVLVPNHKELAANRTVIDWPCAIVEKAGEDGIRLHKSERTTSYPSKAQHVYDVTGAGDIVTAIIGATMAVRGELEDGCRLANIAAGLAVSEIGTTVVNDHLIRAAL